MKYEEITNKIIEAFYKVYNELGYGFLEKVYENALVYELTKMGLDVRNQFTITVLYDDIIVGDYYADIVVENKVIIELKAAKILCEEHEIQLVNYLKATDIEVGLLLNFGEKAEFKRKVLTNEYKS